MIYKIPPWKHQLEAIERAKDKPCFALLFEMGAGKTSTAINILRHKINAEKRILRTLVFAPPIVLHNWKREWHAHSNIPDARVVVLEGTGAARLKKFLATKDDPKGTIFVTNYESVQNADLFEALQAWHPEAIVMDEAHRLKDPQGRRAKLVAKLCHGTKEHPPARFRYILTGTPVLNSPMDLWSPFHLMDGGETFGDSYWSFKLRYMEDKNAYRKGRPGYFPNWQIRPGSLDEINQLIFKNGMRVTKAECMDLPPLVRERLAVPMSAEQGKLYTEMKKDFITFINAPNALPKAAVATLAITKALRMMQIASGFVKTEDGAVHRIKDVPKLEALRDLLEEITPKHKAIVWAVYQENYAAIRQVCEDLGIQFVEMHGQKTGPEKREAEARFDADDSVRVLIGHPGSGGIGVNLVAASYSIFYSRTFSLDHSLQAEARNHRGGTREKGHEKITRIDLVCENTLDEAVLDRLTSKNEMSESVLAELKGWASAEN